MAQTAMVLLLPLIAGGLSQLQPSALPPTAPTTLPLCTTAIARCQAETACARSYAAFEESCREERSGMPVDCGRECTASVYALIGHPLGAATLLCDCPRSRLNPFVVTACRTSQINLAANCFTPPPGMPMCGQSCTKAWGRCFQDLSCASLVLSLPSQCSNVVAWNGERDLPACCSDCRDTLNMISKLPNALELECCNCSGDLTCEMLQMKLSAACPSRTNCQRDCPQMPIKKPVVPPTAPFPLCTTVTANCQANTTCASSYAEFEESCKEERGGMPVNCTQGCRSAILALITHPLGTAALTCNCSNPLPLLARTCLVSQTNLQANCFPAPPGVPTCGRPCIEAWGRCYQDLTCISLGMSIPSKCRGIMEWNGQGEPPNCDTQCRDTLDMISRLPNALELVCCNASGTMSFETLKMKLSAACPNRTNCQRDCPQSPSRNLTSSQCQEPTPKPGPPLCTSILNSCPRCTAFVSSTLSACSSVLSWDGQGDPPPCPVDCLKVTNVTAALPNGRELSCCDCGEGPVGQACEKTRTKITAACGQIIDCNEPNATDETCPLDGDNPMDTNQCPLTCQDILTRCPVHGQVVAKQLSACSSVLEWDGQGDPPMCPEACLTATKAVEALPNSERLASCDCGEGPFGVQCEMNKMKLNAACSLEEMCPSIPPSHGIVDCFTVMGYCARNNTCAQLMLKFAACVRNTGLKDTVRCHLARIRLQEYHRSHGMPLNCTCVTFPDQCSAFKAALDMPEEKRPRCKSSVAECKRDTTCNGILEAWQSACSSLLRQGAKCSPHCMMTGSVLRQNILGSRAWPCLKGNINKAIKIKFLKLCVG